MHGLFGDEPDCTTLVEDYRLDNAGDYMRLVSSGMTKKSKPRGHPKVAPEQTDDFTLFYGVLNDPSFKKDKTDEGMNGLGCGTDCDCPCNKNKTMNGFGMEMLSREKAANFFGGLAGNLGPSYGSWPPGPRPEPYRWKAPDGTTWTLVELDGKWMYQSSKNKRMFISTSNLYELMGIRKDPETMVVVEPIPGEHHKDPNESNWLALKIGGVGLGVLVLGGIGAYLILKKKRRG